MEQGEAIIIKEVMDLANIKELYDPCQAAYASGAKEIKIDASKVERVKTPIFQLLLIFKQTLEKEERTLVIEGATDAFIQMAECLGIKDQLI